MVTWMTMPEDQTEREKFLRLYGACEKRVYAAAFRVLRDPAPTEDAAQQAWLRLLQSWERVSTFGLEEACGYAVTVAKNAAIDLLRAQRHTVSFSDECLGLNESTVATRIQRGKAMLRERLKKEGYCYE